MCLQSASWNQEASRLDPEAIHEWRQAFRDPLVERRPDAWLLRVPERVWADVRERADVPEAIEETLLALYATETEGEDGVALVIARDSTGE